MNFQCPSSSAWYPQLTAKQIAIAFLVLILGWSGQAHPALAVGDKSSSQQDDLDPTLKKGQAIYQKQCASCHGEQGQGTKDGHDEPLMGDASVGELARVIEKTMPKDEPEQCVGKDAQAVAAYIHYRFYSEAAQVRNRPPRIGLSRLTATQLRQSLADLYSVVDGLRGFTSERGVKGIYFDGSRWRNEKKKLERIDPVIDFDFADASPVEGMDPRDYYIYWEGGIKADVTGRYEIVVHSTCSFVLHLGSMERKFIDNHVQSGDVSEFRQSIHLTAGRVYPFKIDFTQRKRKTEQPPARIRLAWIKPHGVEQTIPNAI